MPWGTWVTCEETVNGPDVGADFTGVSNVPLTQPHGFIFEVPTTGRSNARAGHQRRSVRPRVGRLRPAWRQPVPQRGQLRLPLRLLPLHAEDLADGDRPPGQRRPAPDAQGQGRRRGAPRGRRRRRAPATTSSGSTSTTRHRPSPTPRVSPRRRRTTPRCVYVGNQGRSRAPRTSRGSRGRSTTTGSSTSPRPRAVALPMTGAQHRHRLRQRLRPGLGLRHPQSETLFLVYESPSRDGPRLPGQHHGQPPRHPRALRGQRRRQLRAWPLPWWPAVGHRPQPARRVAPTTSSPGSTFSPDGHTLFVNIQASRGMSFAIWGHVGADRRLSASTPAGVRSRASRQRVARPSRALRPAGGPRAPPPRARPRRPRRRRPGGR